MRKNTVFVIPDDMKEGIRQSAADIKNGDIYTMDDFEKKYEKLAKKIVYPHLPRIIFQLKAASF
jgi:hypothetical protein